MIKDICKLFGSRIKESVNVFKHPKGMIPTLVIGSIWITLSTLSAYGISNKFLTVINIITFAEGGMYGSTIGIIGGMFGKIIVAYLINMIVFSIKYKKNLISKDIKQKSNNNNQIIQAIMCSPVLFSTDHSCF